MERTLSMLLKMNDNELLAWYDSMAFVSQSMAREAALEEFQQLTSLSEYPAFKAKYQGQFLFNDNLDEEDYQPYLAAGRFGYELILNADGNVIVDGAIVNYNYTSFEETMYYRVAHQTPSSADSLLTRISPETKTNQVYVQSGKKKFWAWAVRNGADIYIQVTAQKKNLFGWNDYKADYYFRCRMRPGYDLAANDPIYQVQSSNTFFNIGLGEVKATGRISCNTRLYLCTAPYLQYLVSAAYEAWSSGTGENNAAILSIKI